MSKILHEKSPLHFLPKELPANQFMILDSVRFSLEMADYTFSQLVESLKSATNGENKKQHFKAFNYAWSFIDHAQRFVKLYNALNPSENSVIHNVNYLDKFRNAIQHVDINLEKSNVKMIENKRPIFGTLKWTVNDQENKEVYTCLWISGIFEIKSVNFKQHAQSGYNDFINNISLETDTLKKSDENELNLSMTFKDLKFVADSISQNIHEQLLANNWNRVDWAKRKDVLLKMKNSDVA